MVDIRRVVNGIFYRNRSGCQWRMLPTDFPPWGTVYYYFAKWRQDGTWRQLNDTLREMVRVQTLKPGTQQQFPARAGQAGKEGSWRRVFVNSRRRHSRSVAPLGGAHEPTACGSRPARAAAL